MTSGLAPSNPAKVVVIEDERQIRRFLRASLASHGFQCVETETGQEGVRAVADHNPDIVLLDLGLPDMDGLEVVRLLREWSTVPILILTARGQERDKISGLDAGADDYLTKPFGVGELLARMRVALRNRARRSDQPVDAKFSSGELVIDLEKRQVLVRGEEIHLTPIEYRLLTTLVRHAGCVLTHRQLLKEAWGPHHVGDSHYLRVYMGHLRQKIESDPARPRLLITEPGVGYRLKME
ncbi:MAG: response regulator [Planctomycetota bacterium]